MMNQTAQPVKEFKAENLQVMTFANRAELGLAAGKAMAERVRELLKKQERVQIVFAAAPSQNEFLETVAAEPGIDWGRVIAFHLDEYVGIDEAAPQSFRKFLKDRFFTRVKPGQVFYLNGNAPSIEEECARYTELLVQYPLDIACIGIGENGHVAFNDPPVADFWDPRLVKQVELDHYCRQQQVNDGCFKELADVPEYALTLTIPPILAARYIFCMVPGSTKAAAVKESLGGDIGVSCPATVLRRHMRAKMYLDRDSASLLNI